LQRFSSVVKTKEIDLERLASEASVKGGVWGAGDRPELRNTETWRLPFGCTDVVLDVLCIAWQCGAHEVIDVGILGLIRAPQRGCRGKLAQGGVLTLLLTCFLTLVTVQSDVIFIFGYQQTDDMMILLIRFLSPSDVSVIFKECIEVEVVSATDFGCLNIFKRLLMIENMFDLSKTYIHGFFMTGGVLWCHSSTF
jgi:hypothetical protein